MADVSAILGTGPAPQQPSPLDTLSKWQELTNQQQQNVNAQTQNEATKLGMGLTQQQIENAQLENNYKKMGMAGGIALVAAADPGEMTPERAEFYLKIAQDQGIDPGKIAAIRAHLSQDMTSDQRKDVFRTVGLSSTGAQGVPALMKPSFTSHDTGSGIVTTTTPNPWMPGGNQPVLTGTGPGAGQPPPASGIPKNLTPQELNTEVTIKDPKQTIPDPDHPGQYKQNPTFTKDITITKRDFLEMQGQGYFLLPTGQPMPFPLGAGTAPPAPAAGAPNPMTNPLGAVPNAPGVSPGPQPNTSVLAPGTVLTPGHGLGGGGPVPPPVMRPGMPAPASGAPAGAPAAPPPAVAAPPPAVAAPPPAVAAPAPTIAAPAPTSRGIVTAPSPSQTATAAASTDLYKIQRDRATHYVADQLPLEKVYQDTNDPKVTFGPGTKESNDFQAFLYTQAPDSFKPYLRDPAAIAKRQGGAKYLVQSMVTGSPFASQSDALLATAQAGSPHEGLINDTIRDVTMTTIAVRRMEQLAYKTFTAKNGADADTMSWGYADHVANLQDTFDVRALMYDMMTNKQLDALDKSMTTAAERNKFDQSVALAKKLNMYTQTPPPEKTKSK